MTKVLWRRGDPAIAMAIGYVGKLVVALVRAAGAELAVPAGRVERLRCGSVGGACA